MPCQSGQQFTKAANARPHRKGNSLTFGCGAASVRARPAKGVGSTPLDKTFLPRQPAGMAFASGNSPLDSLWTEYGRAFAAIGTTSRWRAGSRRRSASSKAARGGCRIRSSARIGSAAQVAHDRQIWHKRLATPPAAYTESPCCRAPFLPLLTRDVRESGLICQHCNEILVPFEELPAELRAELEAWAKQYEPVHAVAHWDDRQRKPRGQL